MSSRCPAFLVLVAALPPILTAAAPVHADPAVSTPALAGPWTLFFDRGASCRIILRPQRTDAGDYFLGMPVACRHAIPQLQTIGRWASPDTSHLTLDDPAGKPVLAMASTGTGGFAASRPEGRYTLIAVTAASATGMVPDPVETSPALAGATLRPVAMKSAEPESSRETAADLAGRYAVMREKRDTGCMVTLDDKSRVKGGVRAQLAPGCRDQGIVVFDPSAWQLVKGELVLIARAGHKTVLEKKQEGLWEKAAKEGGKPLGLKKL
jgi:hypothetical protein